MDAIQQQLHDLITRADPASAPVDLTTLTADGPSERAQLLGPLTFAVSDIDTLTTTIGIHDTFLDLNQLSSLTDANAEQLIGYVTDTDDIAVQHLRRNSLTSCLRSLALLGLADPTSPLDTLGLTAIHHTSPRAPRASDNDTREVIPAQQQCATNDEVLVARLSSQIGTSRTAYRTSAAVALATNGAQQYDGPRVVWDHYTINTATGVGNVAFAGRHLDKPHKAWHIAARTVELDDWGNRQLIGLRAERSTAFPVDPRRPIVYGGDKPVDSQTAKTAYAGAIETARVAAGLANTPGITPGGLSYWAAAHTTVHHGLAAGAARHGTDPLNLIRKLTHAAEGAWRPPTA